MCLAADPHKTRTLKSGPLQVFTFWKVLLNNGQGQLRSLWFDHNWQAGENVSDAEKYRDIDTWDFIANGFHVFTTWKDAQSCCMNGPAQRRIVAVECKLEDLIAVGTQDSGGQEQLAFYKVTLTQEEYDRAIT